MLINFIILTIFINFILEKMDKWIQSSTNRPAVLKYHQSKIQNNNDCFGFWMSAKILVTTVWSNVEYS